MSKQNNNNKADKYKQMFDQQQMIEERRRAISEKIEGKKRREAEEKLIKSHFENLKAELNAKNEEDGSKKTNVFLNDGSFMEQFKKLSNAAVTTGDKNSFSVAAPGPPAPPPPPLPQERADSEDEKDGSDGGGPDDGSKKTKNIPALMDQPIPKPENFTRHKSQRNSQQFGPPREQFNRNQFNNRPFSQQQNFPQSGGPPQNFQQGVPPQNFPQGGCPPQNFQQGPPQNFQPGGPPQNFQQGSSPQNFQQSGPPPNFQQGIPPPPNFPQNASQNFPLNGPPQNFTPGGPIQNFQQGGPPQNFTPGPQNFPQVGPPPNFVQGGPPNTFPPGPPNFPQGGQPNNFSQSGPPSNFPQSAQPPGFPPGGPPNFPPGPPTNFSTGGPSNFSPAGPPNFPPGGPPGNFPQGGPPANFPAVGPPGFPTGGPHQGGPPAGGFPPGPPPPGPFPPNFIPPNFMPGPPFPPFQPPLPPFGPPNSQTQSLIPPPPPPPIQNQPTPVPHPSSQQPTPAPVPAPVPPPTGAFPNPVLLPVTSNSNSLTAPSDCRKDSTPDWDSEKIASEDVGAFAGGHSAPAPAPAPARGHQRRSARDEYSSSSDPVDWTRDEADDYYDDDGQEADDRLAAGDYKDYDGSDQREQAYTDDFDRHDSRYGTRDRSADRKYRDGTGECDIPYRERSGESGVLYRNRSGENNSSYRDGSGEPDISYSDRSGERNRPFREEHGRTYAQGREKFNRRRSSYESDRLSDSNDPYREDLSDGDRSGGGEFEIRNSPYRARGRSVESYEDDESKHSTPYLDETELHKPDRHSPCVQVKEEPYRSPCQEDQPVEAAAACTTIKQEPDDDSDMADSNPLQNSPLIKLECIEQDFKSENKSLTDSCKIKKEEIKSEVKMEASCSARGTKRRSRWGDATADVKPPGVVTPALIATASKSTPSINITGMSGCLLSKVTKRDKGLMQYALSAYGSVSLSEEDWNKAEDNYKIHLLYQDMMQKRAEVERLQSQGRNKYEYDSDEDIEGGTWEHRAREKEMIATKEWASKLTEMARGKHHIGDFLPPEELKKFMDKYTAVKGGGAEPDLSDYKEFKLTEENKGFQMLQKLGWSQGQGLGADGSGILDPVNKARNRDSNMGLGAERPDDLASGDDEYEAYRKRMMLAYRFRPNPLNNPRRPYY